MCRSLRHPSDTFLHRVHRYHHRSGASNRLRHAQLDLVAALAWWAWTSTLCVCLDLDRLDVPGCRLRRGMQPFFFLPCLSRLEPLKTVSSSPTRSGTSLTRSGASHGFSGTSPVSSSPYDVPEASARSSGMASSSQAFLGAWPSTFCSGQGCH